MHYSAKKFLTRLICTLLVLAVALLFILPLVWMVCSSLKTTSEVFATPFSWLPQEFQWKNYVRVWTEQGASLVQAYLNTFFIVAVGTFGQLFIASLAAYAFAKVKFKGKNVIFLLYLASMMVPQQVTIIPQFMMFRTVGLYNSLWTVILPGWFGATTVFLLRQFYMSLPDSLVEAGKIDGASHFRIFWQIMLPLTKSALVSSAVLAFINFWNEYLGPLIFLTKPEKYTVSQVVRWYLLDDAQRYDLTMAAATSCIIPVVIFVIASQKYFVEGISTSGIKG